MYTIFKDYQKRKPFKFCLRSLAETTVDFGARRSDFESGSSVSGRSGQMSQYTAGGRLVGYQEKVSNNPYNVFKFIIFLIIKSIQKLNLI